MFNWGHHIYNLPASPWIRIISYAISMTEWIILLNIINDFKNSEKGLFSEKNLSTCFLGWSEFWVLMNLMLALLMSIPAVNRYTHGSLITVAHSMGTTIGINSMILLGVLFHTLGRSGELTGRRIIRVFNVSLLAFWLILIGAGMAMFNHKTQMAGSLHEPHMRIWLLTFASAGIFVASGIIWSGAAILRALKTSVRQP